MIAPSFAATLRGVPAWSRRRWLAVALTVPALVAAFASVGPPWSVWWAAPSTVVSAVVAALVLASYVPEPGSGRRVDVGCSPCAVLAAATVLGAMVLRSSAPTDAGIAVVALMLLGFGLVQRLQGGAACTVPVGPAGDPAVRRSQG